MTMEQHRLILVFLICFNLLAAVHMLKNDKCQICGYTRQTLKSKPQIVNGHPIEVTKYPWLVAISQHTGGIFCTGALIHSKFVLTAAHCVQDYAQESKGSKKLNFLKPTKLLVRFYRKGQGDDEPSFTRNVSHVLPSPDFQDDPDEGVLLHDIALLELDKKVKCDEETAPICLVNEDESKPGDELSVAGWGYYTEKGQKEHEKRKLREGKIKRVESKMCTKNAKTSKAADTIICGKSGPSKQINCQGDSGGSVFKKIDGSYYSLGVGSSIQRKSHQQPCSLEARVKFTKVYSHLKWIKKQVHDIPKPKKRD